VVDIASLIQQLNNTHCEIMSSVVSCDKSYSYTVNFMEDVNPLLSIGFLCRPSLCGLIGAGDQILILDIKTHSQPPTPIVSFSGHSNL
jgi:hypothetical protein